MKNQDLFISLWFIHQSKRDLSLFFFAFEKENLIKDICDERVTKLGLILEIYIYRQQTKLREGNVFTGEGMHGCWCAWLGERVYGWGGGVHDWWLGGGVCMAGEGVCMVCSHGHLPVWLASWRYASYWNTVLFIVLFFFSFTHSFIVALYFIVLISR